MAEKKTITLEVVVDDKGAASVKVLTSEIKKLNDVRETSAKQVKKATTNNAALAQQITELANSKRRTIEVIQQEIKLRKQLIAQTASTNEGYLKGTMQVQRLERELRMLTKTQSSYNARAKSTAKNLGSVRSATGNATGMMVELGRTISDANYGITGMANNLQQLASTFILTTKTSGGVLATLKDLGKSFLGVGGLLVIFSTAITLFERMSMKAKENKNEIKNLNEELAKSQSEVETFEIFGQIFKEAKKETDEYRLALEKLKKDGFDPSKGSIDDFLEVKRAERTLDIEQKALKEKQLKALEEEVRLKNAIRTENDKIKAGFKDIATGQGFVSAKTQEENAKRVLANLQNQFKLNAITIEGVNTQIKDSFLSVTKELSDNPFIGLFLGTEDDTDVDFVEGIAIGLDEAEEWLAENELRFEDLRKKTQIFDPDDVSVMDEYDPDTDPELQNLLDRYKRMKEADEEYALFKKDLTDRTLDMLQNSFGKETAIAKAAFVAKQIIAAKEIFLEAKKTITFTKLGLARSKAAVAEGSAQTAKVGFPQNIPLLALYAVQAASILSSIKSAFKTSEDAASGLGGGSAGSVGGAVTPPAAPDFNIVGASPTSQLAETIATAEQQPIKAFVVSEEVTTAQQLDRNIVNGASLG